jgi:hypothetical protein
MQQGNSYSHLEESKLLGKNSLDQSLAVVQFDGMNRDHLRRCVLHKTPLTSIRSSSIDHRTHKCLQLGLEVKRFETMASIRMNS